MYDLKDGTIYDIEVKEIRCLVKYEKRNRCLS